MDICRRPTLALCCLLAGLSLTREVYGSSMWEGYWNVFDRSNQSRVTEEINNGTVYASPDSYPSDSNSTGTSEFWDWSNQTESDWEPDNTYNISYPNVPVFNVRTKQNGTSKFVEHPVMKEDSDKKQNGDSEKAEVVEKLKVETSGSSTAQEVHFALSIVPLLRAQRLPARLDAEVDILRYFKQHSG